MGDKIIQLDQVVYQYPDAQTRAVNDVTLDVEKGEFLAVLGRNGSGKSTLAKLMNALLTPTGGTVTVGGAVQFAVTSKRLAEDTRELIASLGHRVRMTTKRVRGRSEESSTCYTLTFITDDQVFAADELELAVTKYPRGRG